MNVGRGYYDHKLRDQPQQLIRIDQLQHQGTFPSRRDVCTFQPSSAQLTSLATDFWSSIRAVVPNHGIKRKLPGGHRPEPIMTNGRNSESRRIYQDSKHFEFVGGEFHGGQTFVSGG